MAGSIFSRSGFEEFVLTFPAATLVRQWHDDSVAKVGGKIFALFDREDGEIWFKASDMSFTLLVEHKGVRPAPYFARAKWVAVSRHSPLSEDDICAYIGVAHRLVAMRLTRRKRAELGLDFAVEPNTI